MTDLRWIDAALTSARPQAVAALLRYFRDLDTAEEAFQEASLRALKVWPVKGPPRDPAAWLIFVGRNSGLDGVRRRRKETALPSEEVLSDDDDAEASLADQLDAEHYRDDILRLLFICCHPELPATQQIALALRIVSGLTVKEIARAFLVSEAAMEQRITRAKRAIGSADVPFETPGAEARSDRLAAVAAMIYLLFNEGYSASGGTAHVRVVAVRRSDPPRAVVAATLPERARSDGPDGVAAATARACAAIRGGVVLLLGSVQSIAAGLSSNRWIASSGVTPLYERSGATVERTPTRISSPSSSTNSPPPDAPGISPHGTFTWMVVTSKSDAGWTHPAAAVSISTTFGGRRPWERAVVVPGAAKQCAVGVERLLAGQRERPLSREHGAERCRRTLDHPVHDQHRDVEPRDSA